MATGEQRCGNCGELSPARAKFCLECGSPLSGAGSPVSKPDLVDQLPQQSNVAGERRIVTVLFADLSGFTAYSEGTDVEDVRAIAQETADRLGDIVERYDGTVDKIIGDCVMAVWGAPKAHEDDPERAVRAAIDMQAHVAANQDRFAGLVLSVGVQTGEAMWAPVGPDGRYTVFGDTVNTAARIQGAANKSEILIGLATHNRIGEEIDCEALEPIKAKNKAEPVPVWRVLGVHGERAAHKPVLAPLTGRDSELARMREIWALVNAERRAYEITVLGPAGVGKSRLIAALTETVGSTALVLRGRCLPYGEGITYWPVVEIIQQVAGIHHGDDREQVSMKLGALLESLGSDDLDELRTMAVALANVIGAPKTPRGTYSATEISKGELHWGLRRILELGASNLPIVLVLEDLHWAEPSFVELIEFIFDGSVGSPILGLCLARPEFKDKGGKLLKSNGTRRVIDLETLDDEAARAIVSNMLGDVADETVDEILKSAGGNPLFLEEIAQMWRESGELEGSVPAGLRALIDSRLDHLPDEERRIVTHASVVGDVFWSRTLSHLEGGWNVDDVLDALEARDLIRARGTSTVTGEQEYGFKHGLIRDAAYARLSKAERVRLHQRCGDWMAELPGGEEEFAEIIAYHLEQACRTAADLSLADAVAPMLPAANALALAADKAERREGMREAERFYARAIDLLGENFPERVLELRLLRARHIVAFGQMEEANEDFRAIAERAPTLDRPDLQCRALAALAVNEVTMGMTEAMEHAVEAERLAKQIGNSELRVQAMYTRAQAEAQFEGQSATSIETLHSAIALAEENEDIDSALRARLTLGVTYFNAGDLAPAEIQFERCLELARMRGSLRASSWLHSFLGLIRYHRGPREEADELFARAIEWMQRTNDRYMQIQALVWRSEAALRRDDVDLALKLLRTAETAVQAFGGPLAVKVYRYLAETLARQGRTGEVREAVASAREHAVDGDPIAEATALVAQAFEASVDGDDGGVRVRFAQAFPILEQANRIDLGEARLTLARLLELMGDQQAVEDQLEKARELFERMGADATVAEIDERLARMRDADLERTPTADADRVG